VNEQTIDHVGQHPTGRASDDVPYVKAAPWSDLNVIKMIDRPGIDPDRIALVCEAERRTYGQIKDRYRRVAHALADLGLDRFARVGVTMTNRVEYFEIELGITGAAGIMVGLSWRLTAVERVNLLRRSRAQAVIAEEQFVPPLALARDQGQLPDLRWIVSLGEATGADFEYEELCAKGRADPLTVPPMSFDDPHEIIYTSGTTGQPKGAVWSNGTVMWNSIQQVMDFGLEPGHSNYVTLDLHYIGGRHDFTFAMLHQGATVHLRPSGGFDSRQVVEYVAEHKISHVLWVPTMLYEILRLSGLAEIDLSHLKMIMCGGAPLPREMITQAQAVFPRTAFVQVYGLTEGGGTTSFVPSDFLTSKVGSAGRTSMHNEIRIVGDGGAACSIGVVGEIAIKGPAVSPGYWDNEAATKETFRDGWLYTGDLGYLDEDGFLYVAGRQKDMIITGGMNVYPSEVEHVLLQHWAIEEVAVIGLPDPKWGEKICAVVVVAKGTTLDEADVTAFCRERLAGFKKPTSIVTVVELPKTTSGKVQKYLLRQSVPVPGARA